MDCTNSLNCNLYKTPHFPLRDKVGQRIERGRECFAGLSSY